MRRNRDSGNRCARGREWVSQRLDGELSELERVLLAAHLRRCGLCRAFAADVRAFTVELRSYPLEQPSRVLAPAFPPRRRRIPRLSPVVAFAGMAVAAVVIGIGSLSKPQAPAGTPTVLSPIAGSLQVAMRDVQSHELQRLRRAAELGGPSDTWWPTVAGGPRVSL